MVDFFVLIRVHIVESTKNTGGEFILQTYPQILVYALAFFNIYFRIIFLYIEKFSSINFFSKMLGMRRNSGL